VDKKINNLRNKAKIKNNIINCLFCQKVVWADEVLDDLTTEIKEKEEVEGEIRGRVSIDVGTKVNENSVIKGPALIGRDCIITDSYIGPYTSIGNNCGIINAEVEDSVVMDGARLVNAGNIVDSMIGRGAVIEKNKSLPKGNKFIIGDNSWVRM
jgi:glucose-1-phosphate thymidylyltransferase